MEPTPTDARSIRIVLADDHEVVRSGLRLLLEMCERFNVSQKAMSRRMHQVIPRKPR